MRVSIIEAIARKTLMREVKRDVALNYFILIFAAGDIDLYEIYSRI